MRIPAHAASLVAAALLTIAAPSARAEPATFKYALAMPHFNIQYVAGGMIGYVTNPDPNYDWDAEQTEDAIIVQSFEPVLDLFLAHPDWHTDVEMQGYMLDVIAARHPAVLEKLRTLANSGRLDVDSFHYSDQLFLANAREDWEHSIDLNLATFQKHNVRHATTVFCQEGQAGPGMAAALKDKGFEVLVWPKNLYGYQYPNTDPSPLYQFGDVKMLTSRGLQFSAPNTSIDVQWWFVDDGELLATDGTNPYFPFAFKVVPASVKRYEDQLTSMAAQGYQIATVAEYVKAVQGSFDVPAAPPLLDGTWQPNSTDSMQRWLGGRGLRGAEERDNDVRTIAVIAHRELLAAQALATKAGIDAHDALEAGFRLLALGEVSDASGINPFRGEVEYGIAHCTEALRIARDIVNAAKLKLGADAVSVDTKTGEVASNPTQPGEPAALSSPPLTPMITAEDREITTTWTRVDDNHSIVTIKFGAADPYTASVTFPGTLGDIVYTPGLSATPLRIPRSTFGFENINLPISDGMIALGGGLYVIEDMGRVHVAAHVESKSGDIQFTDETAARGEWFTWVFHVVRGDDAAAAKIADSLNAHPTLYR